MLRQIRLLSKIQLCNLFGLNEIRYTKDNKKKRRFVEMAFVWAFVIAMLIFYVTIISVAFEKIGFVEIIPIYLFTVTSIIIVFFTFLKASAVIFQMKSYELLVSCPVSGTAIVVSRFFTMYITNLLLSLIVITPGMLVYGINMGVGLDFYIIGLLGILVLPLVPITLATAIGALITAISSRMRHKSLVSALLSILLVSAILIGNTFFSTNQAQISMEAVKDMSSFISEQIKKIYLPAYWFAESVKFENSFASKLGYILLLIVVSAIIFIVLVTVLQKFFLKICMALNATSAKNNYKMQELHANSIVAALWKKELKRFFSSSIWVTNTVVGYLIMAGLGIAVLVVGTEKLENMLEIPHVLEIIFPFLLGIVGNIMPTTASSISMEGKNWWIAQSLPIRMKDIILSKILVNLAVAGPFYLIGVICGCIALNAGVLGCVWIVLIPAVITVCAAVAGITLNLAMPVMKWDNEARVVKQSAAALVSMLVTMIIGAIGIALVVLLPEVNTSLKMIGFTVLLLVITLVMYINDCKKKPLNI